MADAFSRIKDRYSEDELSKAEERARLYRGILGPDYQTTDEAMYDILLAMHILGALAERLALETLVAKYHEQVKRAGEWDEVIDG